MLLSKIITMFGTPQDLNTVPPTLFIEAMDKDSCGKEEYIGRGVAKLTMKLVGERIKLNEKKLRLEWVELFNAGEHAGDVLSAFEMIELMHEKEALPLTKESSRKHDFRHIPPYIRPHLILYSLKVLFWGLRRHGMAHLKLEANPLVTIEVGCKLIKSCSKDQRDGNFTSSLAATDVELPEDFNYCPPITIKVWEKRSFGRLVLVGSHIINCVECIIKREYAYSTWPVPIANKVDPLEEFSEESTDESSDDDENNVKQPLLKVQKPRLGNLNLDRLLPRDRANTRKIIILDDTQHYDWWTKYYESVALEALKSRKKCAGKKPCFAKCEDFSLETGEGIDHTQQNGPELEAEVNEGEGRENENKKKSILNPILRKVSDVIKMTMRREDKFTKKTPRKNSDEISNDQNSSKEINSVSSFTIYRSELEEQPEFNRFEDWVNSFILLHGKKRRSEFQERRIVGKFKGSVELNKRDLTQAEGSDDPLEASPDTAHHPTNKTSTNSSNSSVVLATPLLIPTYEVLVRVYVVRAFSLPPKDLSGSSDPYVVVSVGQRISKWADIKRQSKFGRRVSGDRTQYLHQDLNPIFGRCYTVEATLPRDNEITISVWDWDLGGYDDLIGETTIDIENRFFTKHRATCGISSSYENSGYNAWRDSEKPSSILKNLCKHYLLPAPIYKSNHIQIGDSIFYSDNINSSDSRGHQKEKLALEVLKQWNKITTKDGKPGLSLVPEHIETRSLYHPKKERISQGKLEMWVDMFHLPKKVENESEDHFLGPSVDITPRKPEAYELRVIIWNTSSVELQDTSIFNEQSSDIYVKGWLYDPHMDGQVTDVHYRSLTGEGNFNWRFVFPLLYLQAEKSMVMIAQETTTEKAVKFFQSLITTSEGQEKAKKLPCHLKLQIWDEDSFTADDFIGAVSLDLTSCPIGAKTAKECKPSMLEEDGKKVDLFKIRHLKGWWPVGKSEVRTGQNGKNDSSLFVLTGKIEAELQMMTDGEANASPAGRGREGPDAMPEPKRPDTSFSWLRNPIISFKFGIWKQHKTKIIILLIIVLIIIFLLLMLYSFPGYLVQRILGVL
ncbi:otoferlin-like [Ischnura elegans]|uniref:otoferlin-like n=1 Tax=Ischnura elegans TaxID=197161 RepID=UPI001ED883E6|nr:otoferlin-like [Ischnura elegans]